MKHGISDAGSFDSRGLCGTGVPACPVGGSPQVLDFVAILGLVRANLPATIPRSQQKTQEYQGDDERRLHQTRPATIQISADR